MAEEVQHTTEASSPEFDGRAKMEQYKSYLGSIEASTARRQQSNQFFLGLLTSLLAAMGLLLKETLGADPVASLEWQKWVFGIGLGGGVIGIALCYTWRQYLDSNISINQAKFTILNQMEASLPFQPFVEEWKILSKTKYLTLGNLEGRLPLILGISYAILLAISIIKLIP